MASRHEPGNLPKRKLTTYGKTTRKRQPKPTFSSATTTNDSVSEDDPLSAPITTTTTTPTARRQPSLVPSPSHQAPAPKFPALDRATQNNAKAMSAHKISGSERKRKISQVYPTASKGRAQASTQSGDDSSPAAPEPRRSRTSKLADARPVKRGADARTRIQSIPPESMDVDVAEARLSSPPLTPSPPKPVRQTTKAASRQVKSLSANKDKTKDIKPAGPRQHQIPLHLARNHPKQTKQANAPSVAGANVAQPVFKARPTTSNPSKKPRKRLIDTLIQQTEEEATETVDEAPESPIRSSQPISSQTSDASLLDSQSLPTTPNTKSRTSQTIGTRTFARTGSALKFTYGQGRKVLEEEESLLDSLTLPEEASYPLKGRRLELGGAKKMNSPSGPFDDDDGTADGSPSSKLKDIHELRQAGANSRVAESMQDLIDQIASPSIKPSSSRRAALLQVAEKVRDKAFIRQCRDHGVEATIVKGVGNEVDNISGFLILSIIVMTATKLPSSHIIRLLRLEAPGPLFVRLLGIQEDVTKLVRDRKSNVSRRNQNAIIALQDALRELPIWDGAGPSRLSPRTLAIKSLQLLITQDANVASDPAIFSPAVTECLFGVLSEAMEGTDYWDYPAAGLSLNLFGALSVLDVHAVGIADLQHINHHEWTTSYLPIVADVLSTSLRMPAQENKQLETSVLKLAINVTNNNLEAPDVFASKGLLPALAGSIASNFTQVLTSISQESWTEGILDSLVLRLGILINFSEHSDLVRRIVNDCQHEDQQPVDKFIRLFLENHRRTSEADSMEKSHLNVAFGYLSVLLGYLALHAPVRKKLKSSHSAKSIGPLIDSIREFIAHYKKVESAMDESEDDARAQSGYAGRLQELVQQLEDRAAYD